MPRSTSLNIQSCSNLILKQSAVVRCFLLCLQLPWLNVLQSPYSLWWPHPSQTYPWTHQDYDLWPPTIRCRPLRGAHRYVRSSPCWCQSFRLHEPQVEDLLGAFLSPVRLPYLHLMVINIPQADVYDHMDYILTSLDMFASIAENLIQYTFNVSYLAVGYVHWPDRTIYLACLIRDEWSDVSLQPYHTAIAVQTDTADFRRRLTLATIIFLPLTLLTGYFVCSFPWYVSPNLRTLCREWISTSCPLSNCTPTFCTYYLYIFGSLCQPVEFQISFWEIALPVMVVLVPLFTLPDIKRLIHYVEKRMSSEVAVRVRLSIIAPDLFHRYRVLRNSFYTEIETRLKYPYTSCPFLSDILFLVLITHLGILFC